MRRIDIDLPRLAALSDGVFAVAMTLLVATLPLPRTPADLGAASLRDALLAVLPQLRDVAVSFFVAALYWLRHHDLVRALARCNSAVMWLNFLLLFGVVLTPLATHLLGAFPRGAVTVDIYAANLAFIGTVLLIIWWYAIRHEGLLKATIEPKDARRELRGLAASILVLLSSIPLAWVNADIALWSWLLLAPIAWRRW
jgi:uncharacterized membrane protein